MEVSNNYNNYILFLYTNFIGGPSSALREITAKQKEIEAYERLTQVIPTTDDDHLDLSLEQEELFLYQYLSLLNPE